MIPPRISSHSNLAPAQPDACVWARMCLVRGGEYNIPSNGKLGHLRRGGDTCQVPTVVLAGCLSCNIFQASDTPRALCPAFAEALMKVPMGSHHTHRFPRRREEPREAFHTSSSPTPPFLSPQMSPPIMLMCPGPPQDNAQQSTGAPSLLQHCGADRSGLAMTRVWITG